MSVLSEANVAARSGTFKLGDLEVYRLGFGAMRITGPGIWGPPANPETSVQVLRKAIDLGINLIDTADSYGPYVSEDLIAQALHPYPRGLVIATKGGLTRQGPDRWLPVARPEYLRQCVEMSLRRLKVDRIDLYQLHRIDEKVSLEDQIGELVALQNEGKIRHLGLSEVSVDQIKEVQKLATIVSVQNLYNISNRQSEAVLDYCEQSGLGFIPWFPIASGALSKPGGVLHSVADAHKATPAQIALAWLLKRSPVVLPIPGTGSVEHLIENTEAAQVELTDREFQEAGEWAKNASK